MGGIIFWRDWPKQDKIVLQAMLTLYSLALCYYLYSLVLGVNQIIDWDIELIKNWITYPVDSFFFGPSEIPITIDVPVLLGYFEGSGLQLSPTISLLSLMLITLAVAVSLAVVSGLDKKWYLAGITVFIAFVIGMQTENLLLFDEIEKWPAYILLGTAVPLTYYFNVVNRDISFWKRIVLFILLFLVYGLLISLYAGVNSPSLYLMNYGFYSCMGLTVLFILMISHEIVNGFLYLTTRSNSNPNAVRDFIIITGLYLINLIGVYLNNINLISWEFIATNPNILLIVSSTAGLWGLISKTSLLNKIIPFRPFGAVLYLALAIVSYSTISYFIATGNDPILAVFDDLIVYSHLGFGLIFFIYILSNFSQPLSRGMKVYKIAYDPKVMPYFTFRLAGFITLLALLLQANYKTYVYKTQSGFYNSVGDLFYSTGDFTTAMAYYQEGSDYGYLNHRSNYLLGKLFEQKGDTKMAEQYYYKALQRQPSPYAFANLANIYREKGRPYESLFLLSDAYKMFPNNGELANNLGFEMNEAGVLDSALIYLYRSIETPTSKELALTNSLALIIENGLNLNYDSLVSLEDTPKLGSLENNQMFLKGIDPERSLIQENYELNASSSAFLYNHLISTRRLIDSTEIAWVDSVRSNPYNYMYQTTISSALSIHYYLAGDINRAFRALDYAASTAFSNRASYYKRLGLWSMKLGGFERAKYYFDKAVQSGDSEALLFKAIAQLELDERESAERILALLDASGESEMAGWILSGLSTNLEGIDSLRNESLYVFAKYGVDKSSPEQYIEFLRGLDSNNIAALILVEALEKALRNGDFNLGQSYLNGLDGMRLSNSDVIKKATILEILLLTMAEELDAAKIKLDQLKLMSGINALDLAWAEWRVNGHIPSPENIYLMGSNPFKPYHLDQVLGYRNSLGEYEEGYELILQALEINASSPVLLESYIYQCARLGYTNYGDIALKDLEEVVSNEKFKQVSVRYQILLTQFEKEWNLDGF